MISRNWLLIDTGSHDGEFNMGYDLRLVKQLEVSGVPILRFYTWKPYCISLGRNQSNDVVNADLAKEHGIGIVRRPTGGKAVLHSEELTYSVVMDTNGLSVRESYNLISLALAEGLRELGSEVELSKSSDDFRRLFHDPSTIPCFSTSAVYEVKWRGRKLIGSAQHRFGNTLLQHGSILMGEFHKQIVNYLNIDDALKEKTMHDLNVHTITLKEILGRDVETPELKEAIVYGFKKIFHADFSDTIA
jgi:lipoate-protein ligase A